MNLLPHGSPTIRGCLPCSVGGIWRFLDAGGFLGRSIYGADIDEGVDAYDQALALMPDDLVIMYQCALQLASLGDEEFRVKAAALLQEARLPEQADALAVLTFDRMQGLKQALATGNDAVIDHIVRKQKGELIEGGRSRRHQIRPPIGSPR